MMFRTAECVSPLHPDKICDRISDALVDACLAQDPLSRCAIETLGGHGIIQVTGEVTTNAYIDIPSIVHRVVGSPIGVNVNLTKQSQEIANGVDTGGAGDQGIMHGYACAENDLYVPQEYYLARSLCQYIYKEYPADGKTQITTLGNKIHTILVSWSGLSTEAIRGLINTWLENRHTETPKSILVNPAGDWQQSGFDADTGVTGRKLCVDNYGPRVSIGGGAYSGKDPTKVDRSAAYMARVVAKEVLLDRAADEVLVEVAYAIGVALPLHVTAVVDGEHEELDKERFKPISIIEELQLRKPIYEKMAEWGPYGLYY